MKKFLRNFSTVLDDINLIKIQNSSEPLVKAQILFYFKVSVNFLIDRHQEHTEDCSIFLDYALSCELRSS